MTDPFSDARDAFIKSEDLLGRLLLITPLSKGERESTLPGSAGKLYEFVETTTVVLDGKVTDMIEAVPLVLEGQQYTGGTLTGQLLPKLAKHGMVLGRLDQEPSKTKSFGPMWILRPPTGDDRQMARDYLAAHPADPFD